MDIKYDTIVDGIGFRNTIYCAKCNIGCKGCHNPQSWNITNGKPITIKTLSSLLLDNDNDITFSGGECTLQAKAFFKLALILRNKGRNIWLYSGRTFNELLKNDHSKMLLGAIDVLVDGKFEIDKRTTNLPFRGSSNQRIIDVQKSLKENCIVQYEL
ncbi:MAG: anaerobic ribonucleoside-triphosphate reductase activating protein [Clostridia bacterium]|nr:anaerobic ribonucleoside-triphosphate reductase activating protein [Clostridia bacterium]